MNKENVRDYLIKKLKSTHYQQVERFTFIYSKDVELVIEEYQDKYIFTPTFLEEHTSFRKSCKKDKCSKKWLDELVVDLLNQLENIKFIYGGGK